MKTLSKKELSAKAAEVLKAYPKNKEVYATTDGQVFLDKNRAELHAKPNKLSTYPFSREQEVSEETDPKTSQRNAKDIIADVKDVKTIEELELLKVGEDRKTVLAAIEDRIEEIKGSNDTGTQDASKSDPNCGL